MPESNGTDTWREDSHDRRADPLGIIGWALAGKYMITGYLGSGGFGDIYEGHNVSLREQRVVVKFLKKDHDAEKFQKEAKILSLLDHPNTCGIVDFLPQDRAIVTPFIDGEDCERLVKRRGPLSEAMFLTISRTVVDALAFAHMRKVAHRDIKPSNIMIDRNDHVYLIDFGIAKQIGGTMTKTGYRALTPQFAAPERHRDEKGYNPFLSDIYEFGVTLYYLATGQLPYRDASNPDFRWWGGPMDKNLSGPLLRVLKHATHPDPQQRYASADEMQADLKRLRQVHRRNWPAFVAAGAAVVVVALGVYFLRDRIPVWQTERPAETPASIVDTGSAPLAVFDEGPTATVSPQGREQPPADSRPASAESDQPAETGESRPEQQPSTTTQPAATISEGADDGEAPEPVAAPPALTVQVAPPGDMSLLVDGLARTPGMEMSLESGPHVITVVHPDFPIVESRIRLEKDTTVVYDLNEHFASAESVNFQIGVSPRLTDAMLRVGFNGRAADYERVPIRSLEKLLGRWQVAFEVVPNRAGAALARVDSFLVRPGPTGERELVRGDGATLDFGAISWTGRKLSRVVVYWSEQ